MSRALLVVVRPENIGLYLVADGELIASKNCSTNFNEAIRAVKGFIQRFRLSPEIYLLLSEDAQYYRLTADSPKNRKEISNILNLKENDHWGFLEIFREKYLYVILSFKQETLNKYIQPLRRQEIIVKAVIPLDFLAQQSGLQGIFMTHAAGEIYFKIFDSDGAYYVKKFKNENQFLRHRQKILMYLKREKIVQLPDYLPDRFKDYDPESFLGEFERLFSDNWTVYSEKKIINVKKNLVLKTQHKVILVILAVVLGIILFQYVYQFFKLIGLEKDIKKYQKAIALIEKTAAELQSYEDSTRYFKKLARQEEPLVNILNLAKTNALEIVTLTQVDKQKPIALVAVGRVYDRDKFIKELQGSKNLRSVNLIYAKFNGLWVEFKLILAEK